MTDVVAGPPPQPEGRFKRLWMEFEVEVVDELALRSHDLHPAGDGDGNITGLVDMDINERVGFALGTVAIQAWQAASSSTGIRWRSGTGPLVRYLDETGAYGEMTLPRLPNRREDGTYDEEGFRSS